MKIRFRTKPFDDGTKIFYKTYIDLNPGITVLVGCNGAGKTTMMKFIKDHCQENQIPVMTYDNFAEGGKDTKSNLMYKSKDDMSILATLWGASEGETINHNIGWFASQLRNFILTGKKRKGRVEKAIASIYGQEEQEITTNKRVILLDGIDSGFSIDNIIETKEFLHDVIKDAQDNGIECYIVLTANAYELTVDEQCIDVITCKPITFDSYPWYKDFILDSRKVKDKR